MFYDDTSSDDVVKFNSTAAHNIFDVDSIIYSNRHYLIGIFFFSVLWFWRELIGWRKILHSDRAKLARGDSLELRNSISTIAHVLILQVDGEGGEGIILFPGVERLRTSEWEKLFSWRKLQAVGCVSWIYYKWKSVSDSSRILTKNSFSYYLK